MTKLAPCRECQRHIRVSESACPFCAEPNPNSGTRSAGRSALLTGVLASAATLGCESKAKPEPPPMPYGAPPMVVSDAAPAPVASDAAPAVDAAVPDAGAPDAAAKKRKKKRKRDGPKPEEAKIEDRRKLRPPPKMPYGAPPARNRLV